MSDALKHFPAPWVIGESETRIPIKSGSRTVAYVQIARGDSDVAALIAIAPEMFVALKCGRPKLATYVNVYPGDKELRALLEQWDALIAKAEGTP